MYSRMSSRRCDSPSGMTRSRQGFDWSDYRGSSHFDDGEWNRLRFRLRLNLTTQVLYNVKLGFELRSGNPQNAMETAPSGTWAKTASWIAGRSTMSSGSRSPIGVVRL